MFFLTFVLCLTQVFSIDPCNNDWCPQLYDCYDRCEIYGDPHYKTFDGLYHDYFGYGVYEHVVPCDKGNKCVPFKIELLLSPCLQFTGAVSCTENVEITLNGGEVIKLFPYIYGQPTVYAKSIVNGGPLANGAYNYNGGFSYFVVQNSASADSVTVTVYTDAFSPYADFSVTFKYGWAQMYTTYIDLNCGYKELVCGLCGYYDDDSSNDLYDTENCNDVTFDPKPILDYEDQDWQVLKEAGEVFKNKEIQVDNEAEIPNLENARQCVLEDGFMEQCLAQLANYEDCCPLEQESKEIICQGIGVDMCLACQGEIDCAIDEFIRNGLAHICPNCEF